MSIAEQPSPSPPASDTLADLPPAPPTGRWVVRHKAAIVAAVCGGAISLEEACARYNLSVEEFVSWQQALNAYGVPGLRVTRLQIYRDTDALRAAREQRIPAANG